MTIKTITPYDYRGDGMGKSWDVESINGVTVRIYEDYFNNLVTVSIKRVKSRGVYKLKDKYSIKERRKDEYLYSGFHFYYCWKFFNYIGWV